jgi:D-inositol-3-phosphate glycosyltransferase
MKIQIISPAWPLRGGIASSSERLAQALGAAGHDVEIISFSLQYPSFLFPGKTQFTTDAAPEGVKIFTKINAINPLNWLKTGLFLRKKQPDLVIARFWMPFFGPALGTIFRFFSKNKTRRIALVDNIIPHEKRFGDRFLTNYFTQKCDGFIVMSQSVELEIKAFSKDNLVKYVPHPIYDNYGDILDKKSARKRLNLPENAPILLFFGFIRDYKGLDLLLEAIGILKKRGHCPTLVIAGECYEDWNFYKTIISMQNLDNQIVTHLDFIENEKVASYFSAADLVVQPYKTATQSGISQLAFHFEKPMIVTRVGGLAEIVKNGVAGYVVEPNAAEIATAIEDFFENNRLESLTEGVRREKARFSWKNLVEAVEDFVKK